MDAYQYAVLRLAGPYEKAASLTYIPGGAAIGGLAGAGYGWLSERDNPDAEMRRKAVIRGAARGAMLGGAIGTIGAGWADGRADAVARKAQAAPAPPPMPDLGATVTQLTERLNASEAAHRATLEKARQLIASGPSPEDIALTQRQLADPNHTFEF